MSFVTPGRLNIGKSKGHRTLILTIDAKMKSVWAEDDEGGERLTKLDVCGGGGGKKGKRAFVSHKRTRTTNDPRRRSER